MSWDTSTDSPLVREKQFLVGLDLGQSHDYSALIVIEQSGARSAPMYDVVGIQRLPLNTTYPDVVAHTKSVVTALLGPELPPRFRNDRPRWRSTVDLVVDFTGCGRPVADMVMAAAIDCQTTLVTITGGDAVIAASSHEFRVPKRDLAAVIQILLQSARLRIAANLPMAGVLITELTGFRAKTTLSGHQTFEAGDDWRSAPHDDLVLALALAAWRAEHEIATASGRDAISYSYLGVDDGDDENESAGRWFQQLARR